ncbi:ArnT family glycosyltransferase [Novipirellula sp. SH528]|uniref:ArnT family glycosyltransferase n=1 Tax=Novipirellula sp. SH528 TaxID=3454466 RepID=UPI003F9FC93F
MIDDKRNSTHSVTTEGTSQLLDDSIGQRHMRWTRYAITTVLVIQLVCVATHAIRSSPTNDEFGHFFAGIRYWEQGDTRIFNVNPPLVRSIAAIPAVIGWDHPVVTPLKGFEIRTARPEIQAGRRMFSEMPNEFHFYLVLGRLLVGMFGLMGTMAIFGWGRQLVGDWGAVVAASFWAIQPQIIAHGSLITNDVPVAACMTLAAWLFCRWCESPSISRALLGGAGLGLASVCKFTALLLWPIFLVFAVYEIWRHRSLVRLYHAIIAIIVAFVVVGIPYGFAGIGRPIKSFDLVTDYRGPDQILDPTWQNRFGDRWVGYLPSPLPEEYVVGIDRQQSDFVNGLPSYAAGQRSKHGWWWFYLYSMAVKLPTGTWLAIAVAMFYWVSGEAKITRDRLMVMLIAIAIIDITAMKSGFAQQHRYILPLYPFLFLWVATPLERWRITRSKTQTDSQFYSKSSLKRKTAYGYGTLVALGFTAIGCANAAPDWLGAFNLLSGGTDRGHLRMFNDATDWGQDTFEVVDWIVQHPECYPLQLESINGFNGVDAHALGVPQNAIVETGGHPVWFIISKNDLVGIGRLDDFKDRIPVDRIGRTHFVYKIDDAGIE